MENKDINYLIDKLSVKFEMEFKKDYDIYVTKDGVKLGCKTPERAEWLGHQLNMEGTYESVKWSRRTVTVVFEKPKFTKLENLLTKTLNDLIKEGE